VDAAAGRRATSVRVFGDAVVLYQTEVKL
jgi:hypothetical protein